MSIIQRAVASTFNYVNGAIVQTASVAGVGYLASRIIKSLDPRLAMICGGTVGLVHYLMMQKHTTPQSFLVGTSLILSIPRVICAKLQLPLPLLKNIAVIALPLLLGTSIATFYLRGMEKNRNMKSSRGQIDTF